MQKVHVDTDIGGDPDDVCALAMLLKWPEVEFTGITTVADDSGRRAGYAKYVLQLAGRGDVPVKAGADVSANYFAYKPGYPDETKYWPEKIESAYNDVDEALELLKVSIEQGAIIICIGQFTNLYLLDKKYPGIIKNAKLFLMGGYVYPIREGFPKWGNDYDYNIQLDVSSAKYVFENTSPTVIPLTVTVETAIRRSYLPALKKSGKIGELIAFQAESHDTEYQNEEKIGKTCKGLPSDILNFQHDPLACAIALGWNDGIKIEELPLKFAIKNNELHEFLDKEGKLTRIVTKIDGEKFNEFWLKLLTS